jgi:hypothetical protein
LQARRSEEATKQLCTSAYTFAAADAREQNCMAVMQHYSLVPAAGA